MNPGEVQTIKDDITEEMVRLYNIPDAVAKEALEKSNIDELICDFPFHVRHYPSYMIAESVWHQFTGNRLVDYIEYLGYVGSVEYSEEDGVFHGKLIGIKDIISYEGENKENLIADFHDAVDEYIKFCGICAKHFKEGLDKDNIR